MGFLDIWHSTNFSGLADLYNNTVRNGIAHEGVQSISVQTPDSRLAAPPNREATHGSPMRRILLTGWESSPDS